MANAQNTALKKIKSHTSNSLENENNTIRRLSKLDKKYHGHAEKKSNTSSTKDSTSSKILGSMKKNKEVAKVVNEHTKFVEKYNRLQKSNEKLAQDLLEEKQRCETYQNKFKSLKDTHAVFQRIKENYLNAKSNESVTPKPVIEFEEQEAQTENISCSDSIFAKYENYDYSSNYTSDSSEAYIPSEPGYTAVKIKEFNAIKKTIKTLKQYIVSQPLSTFVISESREAKFRKDIATLFEENRSLKQLVIDKQIELDTARRDINECESQKECNILMKIIAKLKLQMHKLEDPDSEPYKTLIATTTEKENGIIEHITDKYNINYSKKSNLQIRREPQIEETKISTPFLTPRTNNVESDTESDGTESACSTFRSCDEEEPS